MIGRRYSEVCLLIVVLGYFYGVNDVQFALIAWYFGVTVCFELFDVASFATQLASGENKSYIFSIFLMTDFLESIFYLRELVKPIPIISIYVS